MTQPSNPYGTDLALVFGKNGSMTPQQVQQLAGALQSQIVRDARVKSASVSAVLNTSTSVLTVTEKVLSLTGPFTLTLNVSQVTLQVLLNGQPLGGAQ